MARARKAKTEPQEPQNVWHTVRQGVAVVLFAAAAACLLYGAWLAFLMHASKSMPATWVWRYLVCAVLAGALYTICVRIEPLPGRRKPRGKRWINVETPTTRQIWETAPGDFVESVLSAIGMMAMPVVMFITIGSFMAAEDFPDYIIALVVGAGAFSLEGAFIAWRGRSMFDPPGQVRKAVVEAKAEPASTRNIEIGDSVADAEESAGTSE